EGRAGWFSMTVRPIRAYELLDIAYELAGAGAGPGKPKTAKLRRSISTSYYALFRELAYSAACLLCRKTGQRRWSRPSLRATLLAVPVICGTLRKCRTCCSFG